MLEVDPVDPSVLLPEPLAEEEKYGLGKEVMVHVFNWSNHIIDHCKEHGLPIDAVFNHKHRISSTNGNGEFVIMSLYAELPQFIPPGSGIKPHSIMTLTVIRCHDNLRTTYMEPLPFDGDPDKFFSDFVNTERSTNGVDFRPVSYNVCKKLMKECLIRMKKSKKVLIGKENRAVVRLYDMDSHSSSQNNDVIPKMPTPSPAPSVEELWMTLNRPEFYQWVFKELIEELPQNYCITRESLPSSFRCIAKEQKYRERMYSTIEMNCLWYMLEDESEVASWLLWELQSMKDFDKGDEEGAIIAMEQNIILQLLVNRIFTNENDLYILKPIPDYKKDGRFGEALRNQYVYRCDLMYHGTVPPGFIYDASIAKASVRSFPAAEKVAAGANQIGNELEKLDISDISSALRRRRNGCAICGATRFKGGGKLRECMKCKSVVYCCREHQKLHWKNGHKRECFPSVPPEINE